MKDNEEKDCFFLPPVIPSSGYTLMNLSTVGESTGVCNPSNSQKVPCQISVASSSGKCDENRMCEAHEDVAHLHRENNRGPRAEIGQHLAFISLSALRSTALDASALSRSLVSLLPLVLYNEKGTME